MSLVIIVPKSDVEQVRTALEAAGYGPGNLGVPMRGTVRVESDEQATHYGTHLWGDDGFVAVVQSVTEQAVIVSTETDGRIGFDLFDGQAGDYIYVPCDPRLIQGLTLGLGELATPGKGLPYAQVIEHPTAWPILQLRSEDIVPIDLAANPAPLVEVLTAFVQGGGLTQDELDGIVAGVQQAAGHTVRIVDMIPASWQPYVMDRESAKAAGYFGE